MDDTLLLCISLKQAAEAGGADEHLFREQYQIQTLQISSRALEQSCAY